MRVYTVHLDPISVAGDRGAVLVREGFNWWAALFGVLWALYHRLWLAALALAAASLALATFSLWLTPEGGLVVELGYMALVGMMANDWRRAGLKRRGYRMAGVVAAASLDAAEQRCLDALAHA